MVVATNRQQPKSIQQNSGREDISTAVYCLLSPIGNGVNELPVGEITNRKPSISVKVSDGLQECPDGRGTRANDDPLLEQVRDGEPNLVIIAGTF